MLLLGLAGCGFLRGPDPVYRVLTCSDLIALAEAIVDGRQAGQSRAEQHELLARGSPIPARHAAMVESIYDWPRPTDPAAWQRLKETSVEATTANCLNRPVAALDGVFIR